MMDIHGWQYYNHAAIPNTAPHEEPDISPVMNGEIWKSVHKPLLARWTTDFDCGYETNWWYLIREAPFSVEQLSARAQKHIRQANKKCYVKKIDICQNIEALFSVYCSAFERYDNADNKVSFEAFQKKCKIDAELKCEYWGGYQEESDLLIGYMVVRVFDEYVQLQTTKLRTDFMNCRTSDALYAAVLQNYLTCLGKKYVSSGSRNINHKTDTEQYKITTFGYRKAYCKLHIAYRPNIRTMVKLLYPCRKLLRKFDKITKIHQVNAVLKMEELCRQKGKPGEQHG